ncbi:uncharacterized protein PRCAT00006049001 [Priceomyces carsonii]|uniref:uncharacterized protein n=1 Tax=Priceomyces carsonii TaxID=28549 RepID=UPI002EDB1F4C|nr:unnamed protein product [Priceomyces carsonii]
MVAPSCSNGSFVDHELSTVLDSTFAFEGPEKLLEIWFWKSEDHIPLNYPKKGLRSIPVCQWTEMLDLVNCKILSRKSSSSVDAYLLSESSLFVFPHKLILKTCGTTTTLGCLKRLFDIVTESYFKNKVIFKSFDTFRVFYSRRSFMFPDKQEDVHKDWKFEVSKLNDYFANGKSYVVGNCASDDHWYLYTGGCDSVSASKDQTFEVLMTELNQEKAAQFCTSRTPGELASLSDSNALHDLGHDIGKKMMIDTELNMLFGSEQSSTHLPSPSLSDSMELEEDARLGKVSFQHDSFSFTPCGFSSNSISSDGFYYTLHVTPEAGWSYASFETNFPFSDASYCQNPVDLLLKILATFKPGRFSLTLFSAQLDALDEGFDSLQNCDIVLKKLGYIKQEKILYDLMNDNKLLYLNFHKRR